jgi:hypothetical protein
MTYQCKKATSQLCPDPLKCRHAKPHAECDQVGKGKWCIMENGARLLVRCAEVEETEVAK